MKNLLQDNLEGNVTFKKIFSLIVLDDIIMPGLFILRSKL